VFFEHRGLLRDERRESTLGGSAFLYPMLDDAERELDPVLASVEASVRRKAEDVCAVRDPGCEDDLHRAAELLAEGFAAGRKLLAFGNGGSATDAADLVCDLLDPPPELRPLPAISLTNDDAVITAVANDVGFENVFRRQIIAYGDRGDVAVGISTSGNSRSLVAAFEEARSRGLATVAFVGYGGGEVVARGLADVAVVVHHDYIPRIQEAQATQYHLIRRLVDELL
jgi:D-sedoheptulose 7-phosphate isomerase